MANGHGGARPGAGRKSKAQELKLFYLMAEAWPLSDRVAFLSVLAEKAKAGDLDAGKVLLQYAYGRPRELGVSAGEPDALDFEYWHPELS
jgi:hypothetical protein